MYRRAYGQAIGEGIFADGSVNDVLLWADVCLYGALCAVCLCASGE